MFAAQNWSGLLIGNQATYFYTVAGMDSNKAFSLGLGTTAIQWVAVTCAFWAVSRIGRRRLYLAGVSFQMVMLLLIGIVAAASQSPASFWVQASFLILVYASYGLTVGPVTFTIVAEVSSVKLRAQTCAIARAGYYVIAVAMGYISSYSLNPLAWNLQGRSAFIWFGTSILVLVFVYFMVPETKDRSFRELDVLYHRGVPARKFKSTVVDKDEDE
jgi:SP family general alpha glucoside:H+ symporter-like MFS transporter